MRLLKKQLPRFFNSHKKFAQKRLEKLRLLSFQKFPSKWKQLFKTNPLFHLTKTVFVSFIMNPKTLIVKGRLGVVDFNLDSLVLIIIKHQKTKITVILPQQMIKTFLQKVRMMVIGVTFGYCHKFEFKGVGYKAIRRKILNERQILYFYIGCSHTIIYTLPENIHCFIRRHYIKEGRVRRLPFKLFSTDRELLTLVSLKLHNLRKLSCYKPKGIAWLQGNLFRKDPVLSHWQRIHRY